MESCPYLANWEVTVILCKALKYFPSPQEGSHYKTPLDGTKAALSSIALQDQSCFHYRSQTFSLAALPLTHFTDHSKGPTVQKAKLLLLYPVLLPAFRSELCKSKPPSPPCRKPSQLATHNNCAGALATDVPMKSLITELPIINLKNTIDLNY